MPDVQTIAYVETLMATPHVYNPVIKSARKVHLVWKEAAFQTLAFVIHAQELAQMRPHTVSRMKGAAPSVVRPLPATRVSDAIR